MAAGIFVHDRSDDANDDDGGGGGDSGLDEPEGPSPSLPPPPLPKDVPYRIYESQVAGLPRSL